MDQGAGRWLFQRVSGIALLAVLLIHFAVTHYFSTGGEVTYQSVAERLLQPSWRFFNLGFLVLAVFHGLNGCWTILEDYLKKDWVRLTLFGAIVLVGLSFIVIGTLIVTSFPAKI